MKVLHVEDVDDFASYVAPRLEKIGIEVDRASFSAEAKSLVEENSYDYLIVDMAIPEHSKDGSPDYKHGLAFCSFIRDQYPGMPILILTGQGTEEAAEAFEDRESLEVFWSGENKKLTKIRRKKDLDKAIKLIETASDDLLALSDIEIDPAGLTPVQKRSLRIFAKHRGANCVKVSPLHGGLTASEVFRVVLLDKQQQPIQHALGKIGESRKISQDENNFPATQRLRMGTTPQLIGCFFAGCGDQKGLFMQLAEEWRWNYFDVLRRSDDDCEQLVKNIQEIMQPWHRQREATELTIAELRRIRCPDENIGPGITLAEIEEFEKKRVTIWESTQHVDLHGLNILTNDNLDPVLIDFGDIGNLSSCFDPITLELSVFFHPETRDDYVLTDDLINCWFDADKAIRLIKYPKTTSAFREWIADNRYMQRDYLVMTYVYLVRQLQYQTPNHEAALKLISRIIGLID